MENGARHPYFLALFETAKAVHSSLDLDEVLKHLVRNSAEAVGATAAALRLLDPQGRTLQLRAQYGLSDAYLAKGPVVVDHSELDQEALRGAAVVIPDVRTDARFQYPEEASEEGIRSVLCVPVTLGDQSIGVLRVYSSQERSFEEGEKDLLTAMATLGAIAIRNAELFAKVRSDLASLESYVTSAW
jgi:GAF domain-containing protein